MIQVEFTKKGDRYTGFSVSGHAGYADSGKDIVCAGVSSAVMLTMNLLECFDVPGTPKVSADTITYKTASDTSEAQLLLCGLHDHLQILAEEYPKHISFITGGQLK